METFRSEEEQSWVIYGENRTSTMVYFGDSKLTLTFNSSWKTFPLENRINIF